MAARRGTTSLATQMWRAAFAFQCAVLASAFLIGICAMWISDIVFEEWWRVGSERSPHNSRRRLQQLM
ncbi:hypothetical protein C7I85_29620 [Mesorhizobium soli]|uniref:Uncharacterized protein n=1 Tax=Pseudaminobacter soli (ex Li et al. 2025) TaxID=1295366 RepID=A0A2P7RMF7_9HYPH|nr:hypothetical protein C7I85_29620 [Mesorhizobium soli]